MSPGAAHRILWLDSLLMLPLPMLFFGGWIPVSRYLLLTGVTLGLIVTEGMATVPGEILGLLLGHAIVYAVLLWLASGWLLRGVRALSPRAATPVALGLLATGLVVTLAFEVYVTPFAPVSARANLWHVLE